MKPGKFDLSLIPVDEKADIDIYEAGTDGELYVIKYRYNDDKIMMTHWYPSEDDIRRIIDGKPIALHIVGNRHPWVKVEVPE